MTLVSGLLRDIAHQLKTAPREGTETDQPEGSRYLQISDTAATHIIEQLEYAARVGDPLTLEDDALNQYANVIASEVRRRINLRKAQASPLVLLG